MFGLIKLLLVVGAAVIVFQHFQHQDTSGTVDKVVSHTSKFVGDHVQEYLPAR